MLSIANEVDPLIFSTTYVLYAIQTCIFLSHVVYPLDAFLPLHFSPTVTDHFFFLSFSSSPSFFTFPLTFLLPSFLYETLSLSLILPHNLILSSHTLSFEILSLSQIRSSSPMIPKSKTKKTSYVLSNDAFNLSHSNRAVRLTNSPPLTCRP